MAMLCAKASFVVAASRCCCVAAVKVPLLRIARLLSRLTANPAALLPPPCAVPSNMAMARVGGPLWLSAICLAWGTIAACFAAINRCAAATAWPHGGAPAFGA